MRAGQAAVWTAGERAAKRSLFQQSLARGKMRAMPSSARPSTSAGPRRLGVFADAEAYTSPSRIYGRRLERELYGDYFTFH